MLTAPVKSGSEQLKLREQIKYVALLACCQVSIWLVVVRMLVAYLVDDGRIALNSVELSQLLVRIFAVLGWPTFIVSGLLNIFIVQALTEKMHGLWQLAAQICTSLFLFFGAICLFYPALGMGKSVFTYILSIDQVGLLVLVSVLLNVSVTCIGLEFWPKGKTNAITSPESEKISSA